MVRRNLAREDNETAYYIQTIILKSRASIHLDKRLLKNNYVAESPLCREDMHIAQQIVWRSKETRIRQYKL